MPFKGPTRIEFLDKRHPGLRKFVDRCLKIAVEQEEIGNELRRIYREDVPRRTVSSYKTRRWMPARERLRQRQAWAEALLELQRAHPEMGLGELRKAVKILAEDGIGDKGFWTGGRARHGKRATLIEQLDRRHAGLRKFVDKCLESAMTQEAIHSEIKRVFGEDVQRRTISNYKTRRWQLRRDEVREDRMCAEVFIQLGKAHSETDPRQMTRVLKLAAEIASGKKISIPLFLRKQRELARLEIEREKLKLVELREAFRKQRINASDKPKERRRKAASTSSSGAATGASQCGWQERGRGICKGR